MDQRQTLAEKTLSYWRLSMRMNKRLPAISVGDALNITFNICGTTQPTKALYKQTEAIENAIIQGPSAKSKKSAKGNA